MSNDLTHYDDENTASLPTETTLAVQIQKAEIDQQIATARAYPRSLKRVQAAIIGLATLDDESAIECIYALPRGGKAIRGPSIRFAESLKQAYGNCRVGARVTHVDRTEGYVEAEAIFHDLESNSAQTSRVRRRITNSYGKVFNNDMIIVTGNAACSIAMRNAILAGVPKPLWRKAYEHVERVLIGDETTLTENREKAFKALAGFGASPEQIFAALGVQGNEDITIDHIGTLRGMYSALKNGEATVEEMFFTTVKQVADHTVLKNALDDGDEAPVNPKAIEDKSAPVEKPKAEKAKVKPKAETKKEPEAKADKPAPEAKKQDEENKASPNAGIAATDEEKASLKALVKTLTASLGNDPEVVLNSSKGFVDDFKSETAKQKATTITKTCMAICRGEKNKQEGVEYCCSLVGLDVAELG